MLADDFLNDIENKSVRAVLFKYKKNGFIVETVDVKTNPLYLFKDDSYLFDNEKSKLGYAAHSLMGIFSNLTADDKEDIRLSIKTPELKAFITNLIEGSTTTAMTFLDMKTRGTQPYDEILGYFEHYTTKIKTKTNTVYLCMFKDLSMIAASDKDKCCIVGPESILNYFIENIFYKVEGQAIVAPCTILENSMAVELIDKITEDNEPTDNISYISSNHDNYLFIMADGSLASPHEKMAYLHENSLYPVLKHVFPELEVEE